MRANPVYAVFVTFHFQSPNEPDEEVIDAHQALLDRLPRLRFGTTLQRRSEHAFFLLFHSQDDIETYLESPEFRRFRSSKGCYDVFVKTFELLTMTSGSAYFDLPAAAAVQQLETPAVLPA